MTIQGTGSSPRLDVEIPLQGGSSGSQRLCVKRLCCSIIRELFSRIKNLFGDLRAGLFLDSSKVEFVLKRYGESAAVGQEGLNKLLMELFRGKCSNGGDDPWKRAELLGEVAKLTLTVENPKGSSLEKARVRAIVKVVIRSCEALHKESFENLSLQDLFIKRVLSQIPSEEKRKIEDIFKKHNSILCTKPIPANS